jgi:glutamate synthase (NADPH/NADH) small chain
MSDPKGFLKFGRELAARRPVAERLKDSKEFYLPMDPEHLKNQAARCMDCGVPFCQSPQGCPVENFIPDWNDLVHQGRYREALKALHATNNFPEFTGKLCPAPCESACVLGINSDPVSIRLMESSIIDHGFAQDWVKPILAKRKTGKKVAVIGSGPAGLAAAQQLARSGHQVTVFEKSDRIGGLLRYGIPDFKMEKSVLDRRLDQMRQEGVEFKTSVQVGALLDPLTLKAQFDAVCLTIGAEMARDLNVPGRELGGIHFAMDYLVGQNRVVAGDAAQPERISAQGKNVIIIGGGDTGSDCLGTAHRQGAKSVRQFEILARPPESRDGSTPWPLWPMQLRTSHAHEEGGMRDWNVSTVAFRGEGGQVKKLQAERVVLRDGRFTSVEGSGFEFDADLVLLALGFSGPYRSELLEKLDVKLDARGAVAVDAGFMTSQPGVFAAGDAKRGASLIVWAIAEGRKMAASIDRYLASPL